MPVNNVASDWPCTFLHPRCFCLVNLKDEMIQIKSKQEHMSMQQNEIQKAQHQIVNRQNQLFCKQDQIQSTLADEKV